MGAGVLRLIDGQFDSRASLVVFIYFHSLLFPLRQHRPECSGDICFELSWSVRPLERILVIIQW